MRLANMWYSNVMRLDIVWGHLVYSLEEVSDQAAFISCYE